MSELVDIVSPEGAAVVIAGLCIAAVLLIMVLAAFSISSRFAVSVAGITAAIQLHALPILGIYPSICLVAGLSPLSAIRESRWFLRYPWFLFAVALVTVQI